MIYLLYQITKRGNKMSIKDNQYRIIFQETGSLWEGIEWRNTLLGAKRIARKTRNITETVTIYKGYDINPLAQLMPEENKWKNAAK